MSTPLATWLAASGTSLAELARKADTTWITVKRYASGEALVRGEKSNRHDLEIVRRLSEATGCVVTPAQILGVSDAPDGAATATAGTFAAAAATQTPEEIDAESAKAASS